MFIQKRPGRMGAEENMCPWLSFCWTPKYNFWWRNWKWTKTGLYDWSWSDVDIFYFLPRPVV